MVRSIDSRVVALLLASRRRAFYGPDPAPARAAPRLLIRSAIARWFRASTSDDLPRMRMRTSFSRHRPARVRARRFPMAFRWDSLAEWSRDFVADLAVVGGQRTIPQPGTTDPRRRCCSGRFYRCQVTTRELPATGDYGSFHVPPRGFRLGFTYDHEWRVGPFAGVNSLGFATDLATVRLIGTRAAGPFELTASLGALVDSHDTARSR